MERIALLWDTSVNETMRELVGPLVPVFEMLTHLGDGALLLVLAVFIYWFGAEESRRKRAFVLAVGTAALALSAGLKGIFQLPRPDLAFAPMYYPGFTFPSAHAVGAAAFYGALAVTMTRGQRWMRYTIAGALIGVVSLSRVIIGVHFLGDVLVGALLGLVLVSFGTSFGKQDGFDPGPMFIASAFIAIGAAILGSVVFVPLTIGAAVGGAIGWHIVKSRPTTSIGAAVLVLGSSAIVGILVLRGISSWLGVRAGIPLNSTVVFIGEVIGYLLVTVFVLTVPWLATYIERDPRVQTLQQVLPFRGRIVDASSPTNH